MFKTGICILGLLHLTTNVLASVAAAADQRCIDSNGPGWEAQLDSAGNPLRCQKIVSRDNCFPDWLNPATGKYECCPIDTALASDKNSDITACCGAQQSLSVDAKSKTGSCCDHGLHWSYDGTSKKGTCCQSGYAFDGVQCAAPLPASSASSTGQPPSTSPVAPPPAKPPASVPAPSVSKSIVDSPKSPEPNTPVSNPTSVPQSIQTTPSAHTTEKSIISTNSPNLPPISNPKTDSSSFSTADHQQTPPAVAQPTPTGGGGVSLQVGDCTLACPGSTLPIGFCSPGPSTTSSSLGTPSSIVPGGGGSQGSGGPGTSTDQLPLRGPQKLANPSNYLNNTCRGLDYGPWNYWDTGNPVINYGKRYYMPVPGGRNDKKPDVSQYRFPVDTWFFIVSVYVLAEQAQMRVYADDKVLGVTSPLKQPKGFVDCRDGTTFEKCLLPEDDHSRGLFLIPAGTRSVAVESLPGGDTSVLYYATRFDSVCSDITPCQGPEVTPWTRFNTVPIQTQPFWSTTYSIALKNDGDTLLTIVDSVYPSSQWTVYLDGKETLGSLHRPTYLTEDHFLNDAVFQDKVPEYAFSWGAYWGVFLIPKGEHLVEWRVTGGERKKSDGTLWDQYGGHYKVNKVCNATLV